MTLEDMAHSCATECWSSAGAAFARTAAARPARGDRPSRAPPRSWPKSSTHSAEASSPSLFTNSGDVGTHDERRARCYAPDGVSRDARIAARAQARCRATCDGACTAPSVGGDPARKAGRSSSGPRSRSSTPSRRRFQGVAAHFDHAFADAVEAVLAAGGPHAAKVGALLDVVPTMAERTRAAQSVFAALQLRVACWGRSRFGPRVPGVPQCSARGWARIREPRSRRD